LKSAKQRERRFAPNFIDEEYGEVDESIGNSVVKLIKEANVYESKGCRSNSQLTIIAGTVITQLIADYLLNNHIITTEAIDLEFNNLRNEFPGIGDRRQIECEP
jgi:hypothetical protein